MSTTTQVKNRCLLITTVKQFDGRWTAESEQLGVWSSGDTELEALGKCLTALGQSGKIDESLPLLIERGTRHPYDRCSL